jgi:hypothetical protein
MGERQMFPVQTKQMRKTAGDGVSRSSLTLHCPALGGSSTARFPDAMRADRSRLAPAAPRLPDAGPVTPDNPALLAALERQAAVLAPIAQHLHGTVVHPPIAPYEWQGPASQAYRELEQQLRERLRSADDMVSAALFSTRLAIGQLAVGRLAVGRHDG